MDRRTFLQSVAGAALLPRFQPAPAPTRKAVLISMLPKELRYAERFRLARNAGFDAIEMQTVAHADGPSITELVSGSGGLANSFPSGHVVRAVIAYGLLAFVIQRLAPWPRARTLAIPVATVLILLVAFDRLYLDVHWESDVVGGLLLGAIGMLAGTVWLDRPRTTDN